MQIIPILQWSPSKAKTFAECKFRFQLQYGQRIPEPERELKPGQTEFANDRGTRIHQAAEDYVRGKIPFPLELSKFKAEFESLKTLFNRGMAQFEGEWAHDVEWGVVDWKSKSAWLRLKIDALVHLSQFEAVVIDYKTGKRYGNEMSHAEQTQDYAVVTFLRYPHLEFIHTELWYLDVDELVRTTYTRSQCLRFKPAMERRGKAITECRDFPPNPNVFSCRFCPYGSWGTAHCTKGVRR